MLAVTMTPSEGGMVPVILPAYPAEEVCSLERGVRPYTVVEILREVFHEDFFLAVQMYMDRYPEGAAKAIGREGAEGFRLVSLGEPRVESSLHQAACSMAVDLLFRATVAAWVPGDSGKGEGIREKGLFPAEFRMRYLLNLWEKTCSAPGIAPRAFFPADAITEQKTAITNRYLLPILYSRDYAETARRMLQRYYPEALGNPMAVDGRELARRMHLQVWKVRFEEGSDILGQIFFDETWVLLRDAQGRPLRKKIPAMTILINADRCTTKEAENFTIVHECCHVYKDQPFFRLQMLRGKHLTSYTSRKRKKETYSGANSVMDWMELQTEKLTAYVLMEEEGARRRAEELLSSLGGGRTPENLQKVLQGLASFYGVSRSMARYRMVEMGYPEAEGVYAYVERRRIPDYGCGGEWKPGITYVLSREEAGRLLQESEAFRQVLESGCYCYVEGHFCLREEAYLEHMDRPYRRLTAYARHHIEECCIAFRVHGRYASTEYADGRAARRKEKTDRYQSRHDLDAEPETRMRACQNDHFAEDAVIWTRLKRDLPDTFRQAVQDILDAKGISQSELAATMGVSRAAFRKWCAEKPSLRHVVALCIAMDVRADVGEELVRLAGLTFQNHLEHSLLRSMLYETRDLTVGRAGEILRQKGLPPLTNGAEEDLPG